MRWCIVPFLAFLVEECTSATTCRCVMTGFEPMVRLRLSTGQHKVVIFQGFSNEPRVSIQSTQLEKVL